MRKKFLAIALGAIMACSLAACGSVADSASETASSASAAESTAAESVAAESTAAESTSAAAETEAAGLPKLTKEDIKIGVVFNTEFGTEGFSYALYQGFQALENEGYEVQYATSVPENEECETAIENLIKNGANVIYATSFGYGEYVAAEADKHPDVYFNHYSGSINKENMATFFPKNYESEYLCGIVAGAKTESNQIGYLASYPIPECVRMINAFTLGAKSVNPDVTVNVKWTNSWFDPSTEAATATELVNNGSDVIIAYLDSLNAAIAGAKLGAYGFGYATDGHDTIPDYYLTNPACDWETFFINDVQRIIDGTWTGTNQWLGMADGFVSLGKIYNSDDATIAKVEEAEEGFKNQTLDIWAGEIKDNEGNVKVEAGSTMTPEQLFAFDFFVEGVNGSIQ
ncbi:MAG: BMP family ABC transporter substrate-binding protein [Eubacterium sp.]|nr:BMP family ABC transporter substrate-binding protein [Eubacterium sp.]